MKNDEDRALILVKDSYSLIYSTILSPFAVSLLALLISFPSQMHVTNVGNWPERAPLFPWQPRDGQDGHVRDSLYSLDRHGFSANIVSIPIILENDFSTVRKTKVQLA